MIGALDDSVGAVVDTLEVCGLTERTIVVFCSDNGAAPPKGIAANGRLRGRKGDLFEGGHRVPCIVVWPGRIPAGDVAEGAGMTIDFLPTFVRLAGANVPAGHEIDGIDLVPLLAGATPSGPRELHWLFDGAWAVREGPWKLIGRDETPEMLVNLADDLAEETNRMAMEPERTEKLLMLHQRWAAAVGTR
jgi:arylsulfatase A-like enzyme